jgi:hypothetical protein
MRWLRFTVRYLEDLSDSRQPVAERRLWYGVNARTSRAIDTTASIFSVMENANQLAGRLVDRRVVRERSGGLIVYSVFIRANHNRTAIELVCDGCRAVVL